MGESSAVPFIERGGGRGEVAGSSMGAVRLQWPSQASVTRRIMGEEWEEETVAALTRETNGRAGITASGSRPGQ
jgi:hypothetical protein